jgi:uncharacterized membrane protein YdjX (TVP38/TMEM64 family)
MTLPDAADRTAADAARAGRGVPRRALVRFAILVGLVVGGFAALRWTPLAGMLTERNLLAYRDLLRHSWWAAPGLVLAYVLLCPLGFPALLPMITGGIVFGPLWGSIYNILGTWLAGTVTYFLGRALGRDFVMRIGGKRLKKIEQRVSRRGFWSLVGIRFLPLPFFVVNYCAALAGIAPGLFLTTMLIGLTPINIVYAYFSSTLLEAAGAQRSQVILRLTAVSLALAFLTVFPQLWAGRQRKRRYAELLARRREKRELAAAG